MVDVRSRLGLDARARVLRPSAYDAGERDGTRLAGAMAKVVAATPGVQLDYADVVDADGFHPVKKVEGPALAIIAARVGPTRLIDNLPLGEP